MKCLLFGEQLFEVYDAVPIRRICGQQMKKIIEALTIRWNLRPPALSTMVLPQEKLTKGSWVPTSHLNPKTNTKPLLKQVPCQTP